MHKQHEFRLAGGAKAFPHARTEGSLVENLEVKDHDVLSWAPPELQFPQAGCLEPAHPVIVRDGYCCLPDMNVALTPVPGESPASVATACWLSVCPEENVDDRVSLGHAGLSGFGGLGQRVAQRTDRGVCLEQRLVSRFVADEKCDDLLYGRGGRRRIRGVSGTQ
jgi:hypothetical protein